MGHSNITLHCIVLQVLHFVLNEAAIEWVTQNINKQYGVISCLIDLIFPSALAIIMFFSFQPQADTNNGIHEVCRNICVHTFEQLCSHNLKVTIFHREYGLNNI